MWLLDKRKQVIKWLLLSSKNEKYSAYFIGKLVSFTGGKVKFNAVWNTRKFSRYSHLKVQHLCDVIYKGTCFCGETSVGETIRNCKIRWDEHDDVNKNFEPVKHLA